MTAYAPEIAALVAQALSAAPYPETVEELDPRRRAALERQARATRVPIERILAAARENQAAVDATAEAEAIATAARRGW